VSPISPFFKHPFPSSLLLEAHQYNPRIAVDRLWSILKKYAPGEPALVCCNGRESSCSAALAISKGGRLYALLAMSFTDVKTFSDYDDRSSSEDLHWPVLTADEVASLKIEDERLACESMLVTCSNGIILTLCLVCQCTCKRVSHFIMLFYLSAIALSLKMHTDRAALCVSAVPQLFFKG
jgi:hypothetical protein